MDSIDNDSISATQSVSDTIDTFVKSKQTIKSTIREMKLSDIGGLSEAIHTLTETIAWPSKYPSIFAQCPLRPRSG